MRCRTSQTQCENIKVMRSVRDIFAFFKRNLPILPSRSVVLKQRAYEHEILFKNTFLD